MIDELRYHHPSMGCIITRAATQAAADEIERLRGVLKEIEDSPSSDEIERLRRIEASAQEFRRVTDRAWRNGDFSHVINNANQQALWRALDVAERSAARKPAQSKTCPACGRTFGGWETTGGPPPCQLPWGGQRPVYPGCLIWKCDPAPPEEG